MSARGTIVPLCAALVVACAPAPSSKGQVSEEALAMAVQKAADEREAFEQRVATLERELRGLRDENAELRAKLGLAETSAELADQRAAASAEETEKYRSGLDRAVGELNRVAQAPAPAAPPAAPAAPRRERARVSTLGAPQVQILGDFFLVTGRLWNASETDAVGRYTLELLANGQVIDDKVGQLDVPGRTDVAYSERFNRSPSNNTTYSARIRLDY